jgi:hypothetical protein
MATQTALALTEIGKPLTKITLPIPESKKLGEDEIIIKITVTGREFYYLFDTSFLVFILTASK